MSNVVNFPDMVRDRMGPHGRYADQIFDLANEIGLSVEEIVSGCLILVNVLCVVRPDLVDPVKQVANEIIGTTD